MKLVSSPLPALTLGIIPFSVRDLSVSLLKSNNFTSVSIKFICTQSPQSLRDWGQYQFVMSSQEK